MEKNVKNLLDLSKYDGTDKKKTVEEVKAKLRWYTFEASEEEFDPEEVDMLVKFLRETEPALRTATAVAELITETAPEQQKNNDKSKIIRFSWKKISAAVSIGVLALTMAGTCRGTSQAWKDGGFLHWLP